MRSTFLVVIIAATLVFLVTLISPDAGYYLTMAFVQPFIVAIKCAMYLRGLIA